MFQIGDIVERGNGAMTDVGELAEIIGEICKEKTYRVKLLTGKHTGFRCHWHESYIIPVKLREPDWKV